MPFKTNFHSEKKNFRRILTISDQSSFVYRKMAVRARVPRVGRVSSKIGKTPNEISADEEKRYATVESVDPNGGQVIDRVSKRHFFFGGGGEALRKKKPSTTFGAEETVVGFGRRSRKKIRKRKLSALATEKEAKKRKASFSLRGRDPASASFLSLSLSSAARGFGAGALDADT